MSNNQLRLFHAPRIETYSEMWAYCRDCVADVHELGEWYMVHDHVWPVEPDGGVLCIGCLERRVGKRLVPADFSDAPCNRQLKWCSERLRSRILGTGEGGLP